VVGQGDADMTEIIHTEAEAKAALYAAMRRGTDPRWGAEPVEPLPVRAGSRTWHWVALCVAVVCLIAIVRGVQ
jgi:hypothetical protein